MKYVDVEVDEVRPVNESTSRTFISSITKRFDYGRDGKDISAHDNDKGKLIIMKQLKENNNWKTLAVFNAGCWKYYSIYEMPDDAKATKKTE